MKVQLIGSGSLVPESSDCPDRGPEYLGSHYGSDGSDGPEDHDYPGDSEGYFGSECSTIVIT